MLRSPTTRATHVRQPELTDAYLIGGGIASLAAAVHLIQDAHLPASQIHILESDHSLAEVLRLAISCKVDRC